MFVQVIEGRVSDREGLHRQMDQWMTDLRPGATGFLGSTAGVTDDGYGIAFARFDGTTWVANEGDGVLSRVPTSTPSSTGRQ